MDEFFEINIRGKEQFLQNEHKTLLVALYKDAVNRGYVSNYEFKPHLVCPINSSELRSKSELTLQIYNVCISDLVELGFVMNSMRDTFKETTYTITYLGLKYLEKHAL